MGKVLSLQLDGAAVEFEVRRVIVAGYTGRDQEQVRKHIAELERQGIAAPPSTPTMYPLDAAWATTDTELAVGSHAVSGEVEPALLFRSDHLDDALVSVIVDFTDREEERRSIPRSKLQPKPFSAAVWRYGDVAAQWDEMALRSWVEPGSEGKLYQSGTAGQLLPPRDLLARLGLKDGMAGTVLLMGTLPLLAKEFQFTDFFACRMEQPGGARLSYACRLRHSKAT
jgi:hypothetical protein